jgi:hypothetical protein
VAGPLLGNYFFSSLGGVVADGELLLEDGELLDEAPDDGALLEDVAPEELAGGVEGDEVVAGGVEADGEVDFDADFEASSPHAARATAAAAIRSTFFIGFSFER